MVVARERSRAADVHAPGAHALEGVLLSEHVKIPQRKTGCQLNITSLWVRAVCSKADGRRCLEVPKDRHAGLRIHGRGVHGCGVRWTAAAHAQELDLGHDEAVAAAVLAHHAVEMSETLKVEDLLGW